jgi:hypothetical protein
MRFEFRLLVLAAALPLMSSCAREQPPAFAMISTIEDLMEGIVEPSAAKLFEIGGQRATAAGVETIAPADEDEWAMVVHNATAVAEVANILKALDPHAKDGDGVDTRVREADFRRDVQAMFDAAMSVRRGAEARDPAMVFEAGGRLYDACTACHTKYLPGAVPPAEAVPVQQQ